jgi:DNA-binding NarL/FixJ family response regulator
VAALRPGTAAASAAFPGNNGAGHTHCAAAGMKVLIVDDHALIRDALGRVLSALVPEATVLEAGDATLALATIERETDLDLVLLDLSLPGAHGLSLLPTLRSKRPATAVVIISANADPASVKRALDQGALGFIPKSSSNEVLKHALQLVLAGGVYIPPQVFGADAGAAPLPVARGLRSPADVGLTGRQAEILARLMRGEANKVIGRELGLAESTVKNQVTAILKALEVTSRTQAVLAVERLGLALPEPGAARR